MSDSPQVKVNLISSLANLAFELPHELPNNLKLRILENQEILQKSQIWVEIKKLEVTRYAKIDTKLFFCCLVLLDLSILFQIFYLGLQIFVLL